MKFKELCKFYDRLELTSSRIEIVNITFEVLKSLSKEEIKPVVYMTTGILGPDYASLNLGIKIQTMINIISETTGRKKEEINENYNKVGDLGDVVKDYFSKGLKQSNLDAFFDAPALKSKYVRDIWENIVKISRIEGSSSIRNKIKVIAHFLRELSALESKYYVRILLTKLRLKTNSPTILEATAKFWGTDDARSILDRAYYLRSDLGLITLHGIFSGLDYIKREFFIPIPGTPVKCMSAEREKDASSIVKRLGDRFGVEEKYDGYRVQIHSNNGKVELYSRNLESYTQQFPDIVELVPNVFQKRDVIFEGEIVAFDNRTNTIRPFQELTTRSRKHEIKQAVKQVAVKVFVFDLLFLDGQNLMDQSFTIRRKTLETQFISNTIFSLAQLQYASTAEELDSMLVQSKEKGVEGIMVKDLSNSSVYQAGGRGFGWIKYKADYLSQLSDTFDLVVVGAYYGKGKRAGYFGTLLMAAWNEIDNKLQTFCKVGSGLSDSHLQNFSSSLKDNIIKKPDPLLDYIEIPDVWVSPLLILEIEGAEISKSPTHTVVGPDGSKLSLRFPRFKRERSDKSSYLDTTSVDEIISLYRNQTK